MDHRDPLTVIAESYRSLAATQLWLTRLNALALALFGLGLLVLGFVVWQHVMMHNASLAMQHAIMTNTQVIAAQTLLLEQLSQH